MQKKSLWLCKWAVIPIIFFSFKTPAGYSVRKQDKVLEVSPVDSSVKNDSVSIIYNKLNLGGKGLSFATFKNAWKGYSKLCSAHLLKKNILSIVDMSQLSCQKRLYIIDMAEKKLLVNTLVAHGRNSGEAKATKFSNNPSSLQSSLGFYITGNTYEGCNGYSLRLHGLEKGFNDQAESRAIVMHGAAYVNEETAKKTGRIGRSWGCPAVPVKEHQAIIDLLKNGSCLFLFAPEKNYLTNSGFTNSSSASL